MYTRPETHDPAVDELKRRARRRLVGAIVLALAAAVILPLLLESEPKPLGDDVSIQIPPIDSGKFVNPLSPAKAPDAKAGDGKRDKKSPPASEPAAGDSAAPMSKRGSETDARTPAQTTPPSPTTGPAPVVETSKIAAQPKPEAAETKSDVAPPNNAFAVQLAAFADAKAAGDLTAKLKVAGFPGYTEAFSTPQGMMQRVRVGPYSSRDAADAALANLKAAGYDGIVSPAK